MKTPVTRFLLTFHSPVEQTAPVFEQDIQIGLHLDNVDLFRKDEFNGYMDLSGITNGKTLTLTLPFGQLSGVILEIRKGSWLFWDGEGVDCGPSEYGSNSLAVLVNGVWTGSKNGMFANVLSNEETACSFYPVDGELFQEYSRLMGRNGRHR